MCVSVCSPDHTVFHGSYIYVRNKAIERGHFPYRSYKEPCLHICTLYLLSFMAVCLIHFSELTGSQAVCTVDTTQGRADQRAAGCIFVVKSWNQNKQKKNPVRLHFSMVLLEI